MNYQSRRKMMRFWIYNTNCKNRQLNLRSLERDWLKNRYLDQKPKTDPRSKPSTTGTDLAQHYRKLIDLTQALRQELAKRRATIELQ